MEHKRAQQEQISGAWRPRRNSFELYTLLATQFSLRIWHCKQQNTRHYVCIIVMVLTARVACPFRVQNFASPLNTFCCAFLP